MAPKMSINGTKKLDFESNMSAFHRMLRQLM